MSTIPEYMTEKHRECDDYFTEAESAVASEDWAIADKDFKSFERELSLHLEAEETILFPKFEEATGMTSGPTQVMRMEHEQMRALVKDLTQALDNKDKDKFLGLSETMMVLMQQHNMKEEMMLYPMTQQHLGAQGNVLGEIQEHCHA